MRKLSWIIAGILCTTAPLSVLHAAQLGNAKIESKLTEQLKVKIPLSEVKGVALKDIKIRLAPQSYFEQAGISLDNVQGNLIFKIKRNKSGTYVLVSSRRPVTDPILSFLLQVSTANSSMIREYDLLLDPPLHKSHEAQPQVTVAAQSSRASGATEHKAKTTPASGGWIKVKSVPKVAMGATYTVKRGDTLYEIAKKATRETKVPVHGMMQAIVNRNPSAFPNGNGNLMLAGAKLKVPESVVSNQTESVSEKPAAQKSAGGSQPKLTLLSAGSGTPKSGAEPSQKSSTTAPSKPNATQAEGSQTAANATATAGPTAPAEGTAAPIEKLPAINTPTPSPTEEDIASINARNDAMSKQIGMLNDQLKEVQSQMTERNERIEKLQKQIHAAETDTHKLKEKLHQRQNNFWVNWGAYLSGGLGLVVIFLLLLAIFGRRGGKAETPAAPGGKTSAAEATTSDMTTEAPPLEADQTATAEPLVEMPEPIMSGGVHEDVNAAIQEAQLLVSYNLHGQAIELLKDTLDRNPDELPVYRALAEIYAGEGDQEALDATLNRIEERFGPDQRPDIKPVQTLEDQPPEETPAENVATAEPEREEGVPNLDFGVTEGEGQRLNQDFAETEYHEGPVEAIEHDTSLDLGDENPHETQSDERVDPLLDTIDFDSGAPVQSTDFDLDLTHEEGPAAPAETEAEEDRSLDLDMLPESEEEAKTDQVEPEEPALDSSGEEPTLESLSNEQETKTSEEAPASGGTGDSKVGLDTSSEDTRLGLAEAFLSVGDMESFQMIADEIAAEGNQQIIEKLNKIKESHQED